MNKLYKALGNHIREDWNWSVYGITMLSLALFTTLYYSPSIKISPFDFRDGHWARLAHYGILYGGTYFATAILAQWNSGTKYLGDFRFWILSLIFVFIAGLPKLHIWKFIDIKAQDWSVYEMVFAAKCHFFIHQVFWTFVGLLIVSIILKKWVKFDFGIRVEWKELKPYIIILTLVSPLIIGASFFPDFQRAYPQHKPWLHDEVFNLSIFERAALFELCYASGFVAVEAIFRGALAMTMVKVMGTRAVLAMASFYCVFHFGKPIGETIGAFFGGYALGVFAIESKSVVGGIIVHLGVAMIMETMGYLHHYF